MQKLLAGVNPQSPEHSLSENGYAVKTATNELTGKVRKPKDLFFEKASKQGA